MRIYRQSRASTDMRLAHIVPGNGVNVRLESQLIRQEVDRGAHCLLCCLGMATHRTSTQVTQRAAGPQRVSVLLTNAALLSLAPYPAYGPALPTERREAMLWSVGHQRVKHVSTPEQPEEGSGGW
jgi:hypothetical protein